MSTENFIPEVWHAGILENIKDKYTYAQSGLVNSDYNRDLAKFGQKIHIRSIGKVTVSDYSKNQGTSITPETLDDSELSFEIDQSKYFAFEVDDLDQRQQDVDTMLAGFGEAADAMVQKIDDFVRDLIKNGVPGATAGTGNYLATVDADSSSDWTNLYNGFVDLSVRLSEENCPTAGRWAVITPAIYGVLLKDARFNSFGTTINAATLRNGSVGMQIAGINLYVSNRAPSDGSGNPLVLAGVTGATTFLDNLEKIEAYRPQGRFSDAVKGLHVYGGKVIRPEWIAKFAVDLTP